MSDANSITEKHNPNTITPNAEILKEKNTQSLKSLKNHNLKKSKIWPAKWLRAKVFIAKDLELELNPQSLEWKEKTKQNLSSDLHIYIIAKVCLWKHMGVHICTFKK